LLINTYNASCFPFKATKKAAWFGDDDTDGNANAVVLKKWDIVSVDKDNKLPSICEIKTNDIITKLHLNLKEVVHPARPP